ncbi:MAG TPA: acyl carrier protein [Candidatus Limnocylindrales bacterium]|nr:acyl carrier protein [Candidatus Limnocylindrales bacterium]
MSSVKQNQTLSKEEVFENLRTLLRDILNPEDIEFLTLDTRLQEDLGIKSLDTVEMIIVIEKAFSIRLDSVDFTKVSTVEDLINLILEQSWNGRSDQQIART